MLTRYRCDFIDGTPGYYAVQDFDELLRRCYADRGWNPIRIYTITAAHYRDATNAQAH